MVLNIAVFEELGHSQALLTSSEGYFTRIPGPAIYDDVQNSGFGKFMPPNST
jgi:hypothetical protein